MRHLSILFPALVCFSLCSTGKSFGADQPNILLIFADDIGYEALNCYGGLDFETPALNKMAAEGVRFSRAYTSPVCTPSRVSMHTSTYVLRHGHTRVLPVHVGTDRIVDFKSMPTFAQLMRKQGYQTSVTGKWQLATIEMHPNHIRDAGFDSWCIWQIWRQGKKTLRHWNPTFNQDGQVRTDIADRFGPDVLAEYVIDQMADAKAVGKPFLIVHNELLPHDPIIDTPDDRALNREAQLAHMIHYMDKLVGQILSAVDSMGIRDNTYVFFMGDNGTEQRSFLNPQSGEPEESQHTRHTSAGLVNGGKRDLNDAGTHVPLLVWGPRSVPQGEVCDDLIDVVDLFPTFCELSGTEIPETISIDGRSFAPQVHGLEGTPRAWVHQGIAGSGTSVFDGQYRRMQKEGKLIDASALPRETPADLSSNESQEANQRLKKVAEAITKGGPRPPEVPNEIKD